MRTIKLVGISGSLRKNSFNTAVLTSVLEAPITGVETTIVSIGDLPLYNQDNDGDPQPENVRRLRQIVGECDGLVICSPEYNSGVPGVLKNAIDWLSRPVHTGALHGKHALMLSASLSFLGGARMQSQLRLDLSACGVRVIARPQIVVGQAHTKISEDRLTDVATLDFARQGLADLIDEIQIFVAGSDLTRSKVSIHTEPFYAIRSNV